MKVKITINCNGVAFGEDDCDKASELNRIFNTIVFELINSGFEDMRIFDLKGNEAGLMEVETGTL